jgi:nitrogen-specific signal transduction histidine kinase
MFAQDLLYGRTILQCTSCGTLFLSSAYQAQYCSVTCRLREQKRRLRAQMKQAKALRAQGQSLRQIAAAVRQPLGTVKGWLQRERKANIKGVVEG